MILYFTMVFKLLVAHALCDFALQSDAMAKGKSRHNQPDYLPPGQKYVPCWYYWLTAHALICGGGVWLATGSVWIGITETALHWLTDFAKCEGWTYPNVDQFLHLFVRLWYVVVVLS